jgi:CRP-like cAMP-binding protein
MDAIPEQFKSYPVIALFVRRLAIRLLLASEEHSNLFKLYTPTERYRYIEKNKPELLQRISLSQIASYLGVTRETLSRIRRKKS